MFFNEKMPVGGKLATLETELPNVHASERISSFPKDRLAHVQQVFKMEPFSTSDLCLQTC